MSQRTNDHSDHALLGEGFDDLHNFPRTAENDPQASSSVAPKNEYKINK